MKHSIVLKGLVFALVAVPLVAGCKKKETGATAGSGAAPATGSATMAATGSAATPTMAGSAAMAATGSGSAVAAAAGSAAGSGDPVAPWVADAEPAPATSKITGTRDGNAAPGVFDRAIYFKVTDNSGVPGYQLHLTTGCEKFSCSDFVVLRGGVYSDEKFGKDCPGATNMDVNIDGSGELKVGPIVVDVSISEPTNGGDVGHDLKGSSLTAVSDKEIKGKIDVKDGKSEAKGEFTAKYCGAVVFPKIY